MTLVIELTVEPAVETYPELSTRPRFLNVALIFLESFQYYPPNCGIFFFQTDIFASRFSDYTLYALFSSMHVICHGHHLLF
jgi:hypothetical protein